MDVVTSSQVRTRKKEFSSKEIESLVDTREERKKCPEQAEVSQRSSINKEANLESYHISLCFVVVVVAVSIAIPQFHEFCFPTICLPERRS